MMRAEKANCKYYFFCRKIRDSIVCKIRYIAARGPAGYALKRPQLLRKFDNQLFLGSITRSCPLFPGINRLRSDRAPGSGLAQHQKRTLVAFDGGRRGLDRRDLRSSTFARCPCFSNGGQAEA
jgi:hypothetical protein